MKAKVAPICSVAFAVALGMGHPAFAAKFEQGATKTGMERSIEEPALDRVTDVQMAQFTTPPSAREGRAPPAQVPKALEFEYVYGSELEVPYLRNPDLNKRVADDALFMAPTMFGAVTYRPIDWLETRLEMTLERLISVREEEVVILPDGTPQFKQKQHFSLMTDQAYVKVKPPEVPVEFTVGRRNFEDPRLWLYDTALDAFLVTLKPGDFNIEASVSRENLRDLDLFQQIPRGRINNYMLYAEYRGIEDHKLAAYTIHRRDQRDQEGRPQLTGVRAHGRPSDLFNYWTELATVRGKDELRQSLSGHAFEAGGTYRFPDLPFQPSVTLGYAFGSGDSNPDDTKNTQFRQTGLQSNEGRFGGVTQFRIYGEVLDPELSNLDIYTAALGFRPLPGVFVDLVYHRYKLNEIAETIRGMALTAELNQVAGRQSKHVGSEIDIILGFRNLFELRRLGFEVRAGWFFPGDAFIHDVNGPVQRPDKAISFLGVVFF